MRSFVVIVKLFSQSRKLFFSKSVKVSSDRLGFFSVSPDNLMRQRIDEELEQLRSNVHRILSDQQQEFAQAFGLHDDHSSSEVTHI